MDTASTKENAGSRMVGSTEVEAATLTKCEDGTVNESAVEEIYGWRFWMIVASLCVTSLLTAIEATVTATALPSVAWNLDSRELYVWFVNAIFLSR